jgi:hypothetical protein
LVWAGTTSNLHLIPKIRSSTLKSILRGGSDDTKPCGESTVTLKNIWTADKPVTLSINVQPMKIDDIASWYPESKPQANPLLENTWPINNNFCSKHETLIETIFVDSKWVNEKGITYHQWVRAGPRREIFFKPSEVVAAIVTCGGLCPGLNNVVREIARTLTDSYGCALSLPAPTRPISMPPRPLHRPRRPAGGGRAQGEAGVRDPLRLPRLLLLPLEEPHHRVHRSGQLPSHHHSRSLRSLAPPDSLRCAAPPSTGEEPVDAGR